MKKTRKLIRPAYVKEVLESITCDLCPATTTDPENWVIEKGLYHRDEVIVQGKRGDVYPESGYLQWVILDLCPTCFRDKLIPWFHSLGGQPRTEEMDF